MIVERDEEEKWKHIRREYGLGTVADLSVCHDNCFAALSPDRLPVTLKVDCMNATQKLSLFNSPIWVDSS